MRASPAAIIFAAALAALRGSEGGEIPAGRFIEVARDEVGGHFFSQIIYAPPIRALVSWGTRVHGIPIRAHETQHFLIDEDRWIDAWSAGKSWAGAWKEWGDWEICAPLGSFYERDGIPMPRPNSTFYQVCWDACRERVLFHVGSMTFAYDPVGRAWRLIHPPSEEAQPPALLLWSSLCYDPANRQAILFGGGGVDAPDGRPHTWAFDVARDR